MTSQETFELHKIYSLCNNAKLRSEVLMKAPAVVGQAKDFIKRSITNRLTAIENDLKGLFINNPEDLEIVRQEMLDHDNSLQLDNMMNLYLELPKAIRDEIEQYVESRHYVYKSRKAA